MEKLNRPDISPDFTIEDIHKIREYNYERRKNMSFEEYKADLKKGAEAGKKRIEEIRKAKGINVQR